MADNPCVAEGRYMAFRRFIPARYQRKYPTLTIYPRQHQALFNSVATRRFCLREFAGVRAYYDRDTLQILFERAKEGEPYDLKLTPTGAKPGRECVNFNISLTAFWRFCGFPAVQTLQRYRIVDQGGCLLIQL